MSIAPPPTSKQSGIQTAAPVGDGRAIAISADGSVGIVHADSSWSPLGGTPPGRIVDLAAIRPDRWFAVTEDGRLWQMSETAAEPLATSVKAVAVGAAADGSTWLLDTSGTAYERIGAGWKARPGAPRLQRIEVAAATVVAGLDVDGMVWRWLADDGCWRPCDGDHHPRVVSLAAHPAGPLWASDDRGQLWCWLDPWYLSGGHELSDVTVGTDGDLCLLDRDGRLTIVPDPFNETDHPEPAVRVQWDAQSVYDEKHSTHLWLVNRAARLVGRDAGPLGARIRDLIAPDLHKKGAPFHNGLCQGLYDADFKVEYAGPKLELIPGCLWTFLYLGHFYDPDKGCNWLGGTDATALNAGRRFFSKAIDILRRHAGEAADCYEAGYALGLALHFCTDLTQPMHAANYTALSWPVSYHVAYEGWMMENQAELRVRDEYAPPQVASPGVLLIATARRSKPLLELTLKAAGHPSGVNWWNFDKLDKREMGRILSEAVTDTAKFLVAWMSVLTQPKACPGRLVTVGRSSEQVGYLDAERGQFRLLSHVGEWLSINLSEQVTAPQPAKEPPSPIAAWDEAAPGSAEHGQYLYRDGTGHIIQIWRDKSWQSVDLTALVGGKVTCDPNSDLATLTAPQRQLFYIGKEDGQLHRLWYQDGWRDVVLGPAGAPSPAAGSPLAASVLRTPDGAVQRVHYLARDPQSSDLHLRCRYYNTNEGWIDVDLTKGTIPKPAEGSQLTATSDGDAAVYVDGHGHLHYRQFHPFAPYVYDLTAEGVPVSRVSGPLATLSTPRQEQVFFVAADSGNIIQLWFDKPPLGTTPQNLRWIDLTAQTKSPEPDPESTLATLSNKVPQQLFYVARGSLQQLWYSDSWRHTDLGTVC